MKNKTINFESLTIDHRAIIDPSAKLAPDVTVGPWTYIGPNVEIDEGTQIGSHVVIARDTKIGKRNKIFSFASLGADPQDLNYKDEPTYLEMGDENMVREFVTINRGSKRGTGITRVGNKNYFLAYTHIAHDCVIGNEIQFVNHATLAGHVVVEDYAIIGAFTAIHQFCHVGAYSFLSRASQVSQDVLPYMLITATPGTPCGLNTVGLRRRGFTSETLSGLKRAYNVIYRRGLKLRDAREELLKMMEQTPEIKLILDGIDRSERGISRG